LKKPDAQIVNGANSARGGAAIAIHVDCQLRIGVLGIGDWENELLGLSEGSGRARAQMFEVGGDINFIVDRMSKRRVELLSPIEGGYGSCQ
jgi:hypothetical protein